MAMRKGLGKGLGTLLGDEMVKKATQTKAKASKVEKITTKIKINDIKPNPYQPRTHFDEGALKKLAESIKEHGLIQPIVLRKVDKHYEIVAGERRWRASKLLNLKEIEAIIKDYSSEETSAIALVENLQRENLDPIEEACAYRKLMVTFSLSQEEIAEKVGKSRSQVANMLRLLKLSPFVQNALSSGEITIGQARPLLAVSTSMQEELLDKIIAEELSARAVEALVKSAKDKHKGDNKKKTKAIPAELRQWSDRLKVSLGTPVRICLGPKNKGKIEIQFKSEEELERLLHFIEYGNATLHDGEKETGFRV